ncbi:TetR/AcrR family transcriptional regulator [Rhodobacteraceae bacterium HSP-20]|uniref:TetR/AcrR family transcriptional regulator n=1 Tax=Paragemmobacter amnigenus TaxID=2852097 RepID=A0ABS6IXP8_9RHOB|nr:TetR/AcrR family transcriptional regulator [Rhodobacter amnigenus]MBU9696289.1 TetR/AcrR family transcriptional regulator [Rhodobacter amnigenus]MBV4387516.1 TetR/AcrR family transcriptional regulator [Rhodobacter amnigenus]
MKHGYHHGNLRQALVDAALALIAERGPTGFTLSEAAKRADVTPAAVYRHFAGRDDLIAEVARQGYDIFAALMEFAYDDGKPTALAAFEATGRAYLAFARKYPGHYMAMFESGLSFNAHPDLALVAGKARAVLERAAEKLSDQMPPDRRPPATMFSAHVWAMSHGVVELYMRGAPGAKSPFTPEDLLEAGIGIYLRGLGLLPPDC